MAINIKENDLIRYFLHLAIQKEMKSINLWVLWDKIQCPVFVLRGKKSDLLPAETLEEMKTRGPSMKYVEFDFCGHTPQFVMDEVTQPTIDFLRGEVSKHA